MKKLFAYKNTALITTIVFGLATAFGCSSRDNIRFNANKEFNSDNNSEKIKSENNQNSY